MEQINLSGQARQQTGKCPAGRLRRGGMVPAVLYGTGVKGAVSLAL
ncbi:MAG: 50S ribosomal protein L25, partial [Deltaproteobacteria bacterium]|nr:50S ribosomal protein L25 [Deltaproteobacteria bacterium]